MAKNKKMQVVGVEIVLYEDNQQDYISLTDIARYRDAERSDYILQNWMRNRSTIEFIGLWETFHNPRFNSIEFDGIKNMSGSNSFSLTLKRWIEATNATGIVSKIGRYGGTFAHKDIAFEFASWLSAEFKFYLIKEFQRLKEEENNRLQLDGPPAVVTGWTYDFNKRRANNVNALFVPAEVSWSCIPQYKNITATW